MTRRAVIVIILYFCATENRDKHYAKENQTQLVRAKG